jgi:hypothetical protein
MKSVDANITFNCNRISRVVIHCPQVYQQVFLSQNLVVEQTSFELKWADVVTGRHKRAANDRRENIYRIPVINNRYELPCSSEVCKTRIFNSAENEEENATRSKHHQKRRNIRF